jgi:hypothetical protein
MVIDKSRLMNLKRSKRHLLGPNTKPIPIIRKKKEVLDG